MSASFPPAIHIQNLTLIYKGKSIFSNLTTSFQAGSFNILLGKSGIGKSSLLKIIAGLQKNYTGTISASNHQPLQSNISYMGQQDCLLPWATVLENITIGSKLRGETINNNHAMTLLQQVGLANYHKVFPRQLSGGMRQRVNLARTLYENRPIILMDEPFSALDSLTRNKMQEYTAKLLHGKTIILITHDPLEACRLGEHIQIMSGNPVTLTPFPTITGKIPHALDNIALQQAQAKLTHILMKQLDSL